MTIKKALDLGTIAFKKVTDRPRFEAEILLSYFLKKDRVYIFTHYEEEIDPKILPYYIKAVKKRKEYFPLEYILKKVSFYSQEFYIEEGVLIPRPETEILIDKILENVDKNQSYNIAEIGIGSGVVSIILAQKLKNSRFFATDISKKAIKVANKNIQKFNLQNKIFIRECSYLECVDEKIDIIVSNPPYIAKNYKLDKNVTYEPKEALYGGERGDETLKKIIDLSIKKDVSLLACEMGYDQKNSIEAYCKKRGLKPIFYKDLAGFDRGFIIKLKEK